MVVVSIADEIICFFCEVFIAEFTVAALDAAAANKTFGIALPSHGTLMTLTSKFIGFFCCCLAAAIYLAEFAMIRAASDNADLEVFLRYPYR